MSREPRRWTLPDEPFVSQVEAVLLGPLLAATSAQPGEFAWRTYDRSLGDVTRRLEVLAPIADSGGFEIRTLTHPDDPAPMVQRFDRQGRLVERRDPDGTITEAIELEALRRLWRSKGHPIE
jgi:YD repeat-containing protein